jgi:hypothetical protein
MNILTDWQEITGIGDMPVISLNSPDGAGVYTFFI